MSKNVKWGNNTSGPAAPQVTYNPQTTTQYREGRQDKSFYRGNIQAGVTPTKKKNDTKTQL